MKVIAGNTVGDVYDLLIKAKELSISCGLNRSHAAIQTALHMAFMEVRNIDTAEISEEMVKIEDREEWLKRISHIRKN